MIDILERLRLYSKVWGHLPCIPPHSLTAPGVTTGTVIRDANEAADEIERLENRLAEAGREHIDMTWQRRRAEQRAEASEAYVAHLQGVIRDYQHGNYDHPRMHRPGKCRHGVWFYDTCESCIDAHFAKALQPSPQQPTDAGDLDRPVASSAASGIEARSAETGTGSVHESPVSEAETPDTPRPAPGAREEVGS